MKIQGRILSIDYGEKRVGLAISDPLGFTAQGLKTVEQTKPEVLLNEIKKICEDRSVVTCIVGLPLLLSGEQGSQAKTVLGWIETLKVKIPCPIKTWDERLSSKEVGRLMISQGLSRKKQKTKSDQLSAILILQNYLESQRSHRNVDENWGEEIID